MPSLVEDREAYQRVCKMLAERGMVPRPFEEWLVGRRAAQAILAQIEAGRMVSR